MGAGGSSAKIRGILLAALLSPSLAATDEPRSASRLGSPAVMPEQAEFCASLARVMAAAAASFETLRGKARENKEWDATETLPGTHDCAIETNEYFLGPLHGYRCVVSRQDDAAVASADLESLRRLVSHCLGESWRVGETPNPDQHPDHRTLYFSRERGEPSLQLSWRSSSRYQVTLSVDPPRVSITLKGTRAGKAINLDALIDIKAKDEGAGEVFSALAEALEADSVIDAEVHGRVTLERQDAPLHEVFDAVCAQAGCVWSIETGKQRPRLVMMRKSS